MARRKSLQSVASQLTRHSVSGSKQTYQPGDVGYDNVRENIDPHIKTKHLSTQSITYNGSEISDTFVPYTGASDNVDLGSKWVSCDTIYFGPTASVDGAVSHNGTNTMEIINYNRGAGTFPVLYLNVNNKRIEFQSDVDNDTFWFGPTTANKVNLGISASIAWKDIYYSGDLINPNSPVQILEGIKVKYEAAGTNYITLTPQSDGDLVIDSNKTNYEIDLGDGLITTTGTITADKLTLTAPTQNYLFTDRSNAVAIQGQTSATNAAVDIFSKDGDGTDTCSLNLIWKGSPSDISDSEFMQIQGNSSVAQLNVGALGAGSAVPLYIQSNGTTAIAVNTSANVGIKDTTPSYELDVNGTIRTTGDLIFTLGGSKDFAFGDDYLNIFLGHENDTTGSHNIWRIYAKDGDKTDYVAFEFIGEGTRDSSLTDYSLLLVGWNSTNARYELGVLQGGTGTAQDLVAYTQGNSNQLFLDQSNGYVGINKANPAYQLDVVGDINFSANIRSAGTAGVSGSFTTTDGKTVTVTNGIITAIV